jgi:hypothetical protein
MAPLQPSAPDRRELARRVNYGIEVMLAWDQQADRLAVSVLDARSGRRLEFEPTREQALQAFYHPFAYAAFDDADEGACRAA